MTRNSCGGKRRLAVVAAMLGLLVSAAGCSTVMALSGRSTPDLGTIRVGSTRAEVERRLGPPVSSGADADGRRVALYEYERGNDPDAGRAALHIALDVATLGLWEIGGTLIEALQSSVHHIAIVYGRDGRVIAVGEPAAGRTPVTGTNGASEGGTRAPAPMPSASGSPDEAAVAAGVERYAALLELLDEGEQAAIVRSRARQLRDALAEKPASVYLGFNPTQLLRQYAALLHESGRAAEAAEVQGLADRRERAQREQFVRSQTR